MAFVYVIKDNRGSLDRKDFYYYIGCTIQSLNQRFKNHCSDIKRGTNMNFYNQVRKYSSIDNLSIELLEEVPNDMESKEKAETYYIHLYRELYKPERVYNVSRGARNFRDEEQIEKFRKAGNVVHERPNVIKKFINSNCMILKYKEDGDVIVSKKSLLEFLKSQYSEFTMTYDRFKIFCNTGKISKKMWDKYGYILQDIQYLDKATEEWKSILEPHQADVYCKRDGINNKDTTKERNYFLGYINPMTKEWMKNPNLKENNFYNK